MVWLADGVLCCVVVVARMWCVAWLSTRSTTVLMDDYDIVVVANLCVPIRFVNEQWNSERTAKAKERNENAWLDVRCRQMTRRVIIVVLTVAGVNKRRANKSITTRWFALLERFAKKERRPKSAERHESCVSGTRLASQNRGPFIFARKNERK